MYKKKDCYIKNDLDKRPGCVTEISGSRFQTIGRPEFRQCLKSEVSDNRKRNNLRRKIFDAAGQNSEGIFPNEFILKI